MESPTGQQSSNGKKMAKQLTGKRDDSPLHLAARAGNFAAVKEILSKAKEEELKDLLCKQNQAEETALYVACEYGCAEMAREMVRYHDLKTAGIKAKNGYDALHIAAKQGDIGITPHKVILFYIVMLQLLTKISLINFQYVHLIGY